MNINAKLTSFAQNELVLGRNTTERERINKSLSHLEKLLQDRLGQKIEEFIRFGSFTRNTILPRKYDPQSDVDLMVVFNTSARKWSPGTYRKWLLDVVNSAYPNSVSKKDFPAVKLELNHIVFDLVPAHSEQTFFGSRIIRIPGPYDTWQQTYPNDINAELARKNQAYGGNMVRNVIRLCKHWNAASGYPFASYVLEEQLVNSVFWFDDDIFRNYLGAMKSIAGLKPGVAQALEHIRKYQGGMFTPTNEAKQFQWLQKLLPGLS